MRGPAPFELNPNAANVMAALAEVLVYQGKAQGAIDLLERAMRLDPHHPDWFKWDLAWAQWAAGDCEAGLSTMRAMTSMPNMARRELAGRVATVVEIGGRRNLRVT